jgi:hypothetical protein
MKAFLTFIIICLSTGLKTNVNFDKYFIDRTLRFDFLLAGNNVNTRVYPVGSKGEPTWGGSITNLIDNFNYGNYRYEIYDSLSNMLIYSRGYSTLFQEWQTTAEAKKMERSFYEVATFPFPKNKIRFVLKQRERNGLFINLYETYIDPSNYFIRKEKTLNTGITKIVDAGDPHTSVDIAFIAEGYTLAEMNKFRADVKRMSDILFAEEPFKDYKNKFNIWAVEAVSEESGTDVPGEGIYMNTAVNSSFYTFDVARYLTTLDIKSVNDFAATVPHDNIVVLINSDRYGGGGVYNYYTGNTADHSLSPKVFIHEFGHAFAGLGDEYYTSDVAYEDFYPLNVEPWEPNLTTLVNFDIKWKKLIDKNTPVPTPEEEPYMDKPGLFLGGGYSAKSIYRPESDCRMKSNGTKGYCTVCRNATKDMIESYIK